jgi:hypothetical protein
MGDRDVLKKFLRADTGPIGEQALEMMRAEGDICGNFFQGGLRCIICLDIFNGGRYPVEIGLFLGYHFASIKIAKISFDGGSINPKLAEFNQTGPVGEEDSYKKGCRKVDQPHLYFYCAFLIMRFGVFDSLQPF